MRKKKLVVAMFAMSMILALTGCGSASHDMAATESMSASNSSPMMEEMKGEVFYDAVTEDYEPEAEMESAEENGAGAETPSVRDNRKLIKTVDMNVETKEFDQTLAALENKIDELGGYIENLETYNGSSYSSYRSSRDANLTIRIPKNKLDTFLEAVEGVSNVVRRSESVEDVTLTYVDLESHKKTLLAEQDRLLELISQAEAIDDIIRIESRLSEVRYQLESMESQLRTFDNKVDYSTVYLYISEVQELTPVEEKTALERIGDGFMDSLKDIKEGLVEFGIWFVINIPYFILWILILIIVIIVYRLLKKLLKSRGVKEDCNWGGSVKSGKKSAGERSSNNEEKEGL